MTLSDKDSGTNGEFSCGGTLANSASQTNTYYTVGTGCGVYFLSRTGLSYGTAVISLCLNEDTNLNNKKLGKMKGKIYEIV